MNPGAMRKEITIVERLDTKNASGFTVRVDTPICTCRAKRTDATTREIWAAYAAKAQNIVNWEIRARENVRVGHWVVWKNQWHEIIAVQRPEGLPPVMILKTTLKQAK